MAISSFSRYANNTVTTIQDIHGTTRPTIIITTPVARSVSFSTYTWRLGDQIDLLAYGAYGDEQSWWYIADANPEILFWDNITPGTQIRVPNA